MKHPILLVLGVALFIGIAQIPSAPQAGTPITVSAVGEAKALPDRVVVYFTLRGQGQTSVEARQAVRNLLRQVTTRLASFGLGRQQLKEEASEVVPSMAPIAPIPEGETPPAVQRRYEASSSYSLQMPISEQRLDSLFRILDALSEYTAREGITGTGGYGGSFGSIGATPVYQDIYVEFRVQDAERLKQRAVQDGVAKVRKMAETAARQLGKRRVKMVRMDVKVSGPGPWPAGFVPGSIKWQPLVIYVQVNATFHAQ